MISMSHKYSDYMSLNDIIVVIYVGAIRLI